MFLYRIYIYMTATNPHPLANPLNQSRFRNYEFGQTTKSSGFSINHTSNPKDLTVPDSTPFAAIASKIQNSLTVPNQDIPYYDGPVPANGFLGQTTLFKLGDGSVLDMKTCKIVYDPNKKWKAQGYCTNKAFENDVDAALYLVKILIMLRSATSTQRIVSCETVTSTGSTEPMTGT